MATGLPLVLLIPLTSFTFLGMPSLRLSSASAFVSKFFFMCISSRPVLEAQKHIGLKLLYGFASALLYMFTDLFN
jgi:hypothetical protein